MKKRLIKMSIKGIALMVVLVMGSCDNEDSTTIDEGSSIEVVELVASDEADLISEEIANIGEDVYATEEIRATSKAFFISNYLPDCVTITTVIVNGKKETDIDFGEGCELPNGNLLSGIIHLSYEKEVDMATKTISLSLENFTFNEVAVEGGASLDRKRSNDNGNPESHAVASYNGVWPDGSAASFTGDRTREWIEGYGSGFWADNVFLISAQGTYTGKTGDVYSRETISPLRRELSCRFLVSGVVEVSKNDTSVSLDFGDGTCDAKGMLTFPNGETKEIFLRRFNK
ncbi:hypothetical protein H4O18_03585 [Arenibacter sp. BSSL-BM3]|uniref:Lipoprotein n=1 Tax=Arenibacter arenosicollis TaxID=2762274 RepID=A0ABR7QIP8_9FLAO|nr:hypothetical protein [Arenibacter arenosicollis]MBC8767066.1 hypothetical protein [Arenibacter arenosicollis]